jgi:prepilin-type N-terminal cleavage/methylation domain-containing protein
VRSTPDKDFADARRVRRRSAQLARRFNGSTLRTQAGFTLLELLIVVGIIGLLLVLIGPRIHNHQRGAPTLGVSPAAFV